jgi:pimeloyl-ACP methyl ester carboxylesterase
VQRDETIRLADGRTVGFADFGPGPGPGAGRAGGAAGETPVIWCHGGPGCRLGPSYVADAARAAGLRIVGIDRPGYGLSTAQPGRTIAGWVPEALAVADHLELGRFVTAGVSTGGAYALALAALAPERVLGAVPTCSLTDMRFAPARATVSGPHARAVWDAPDRDAAIAAAVASHGEDGSKIVESAEGPPLAPSDVAMMIGHRWGREWMAAVPVTFAQGLVGYADDRIADGPGWVTFDVSTIECPVTVLHGAADVIADPIHARHTAELVPGAELRLVEGLGHFSIEDEIVPAIVELLARP